MHTTIKNMAKKRIRYASRQFHKFLNKKVLKKETHIIPKSIQLSNHISIKSTLGRFSVFVQNFRGKMSFKHVYITKPIKFLL